MPSLVILFVVNISIRAYDTLNQEFVNGISLKFFLKLVNVGEAKGWSKQAGVFKRGVLPWRG
jgi:hypothetical protein